MGKRLGLFQGGVATGQGLFGPLALGDVPHHAEHGRAAVIEDLAGPDLDGKGLALGVLVAGFKGGLAVPIHRRLAGRDLDGILGGIEGADVQAEEFLSRVAVPLTGMVVDREEVPFQVQDVDGIDDAVKNAAIARLAFA